ncbi:YXWGXW repeat-containing protein [Thalassoglobus polymorphus]|uniref:YXWGXW repeat (2 copies) n=1 Tax=Thalassoglobus polymorphus TaxID=2527994 RepID=A0A517QM66_9PLAN|nr:YXWGXW repeat-containing protein [Thalassoglobus polymorphus]QDT32647.1 hypothetical protein Mal48_18940 [Thalassoglobus polymorphus]
MNMPLSLSNSWRYGLACASLFTCGVISAQDVSPQPPPPPLPMINSVDPAPADGTQRAQGADIDADVLTRGPVHEAYAEQYESDPTPGLIVGKQPPELIDELPPEEMPEGANVEWVPGYWAFDEDIEDFIWISGLWRDIPVGQQWIPGYWSEADGGWQWVPGFWTSSDNEELSYLPQPPQSLEQGPNVTAPSDEHFWVPGTWVYETNNYLWRPGYWEQPYNDYMWVPSRYQWTPRGYVYCSGYWDYPLARRGVLFSPVRFTNNRYPRRFYGYRYRPQLVVSTGPLLIHLFVRPRYRHYYFGDYYGSRYRDRGIYAFTRHSRYGRRGYHYDPIRSYYQRGSRRTTYNRLVDWHGYFDRNKSSRPPHTYRKTREIVNSGFAGRNAVVIRQATLSESIRDLAKEGRADRKTFTRIPDDVRNRISDRASSTARKITEQRVAFESRGRHRGDGTSRGEDQRGQLNPKGSDRDIKLPERDNRGDRGDRVARTEKLKLPESSAFRDRLDGIRDREKEVRENRGSDDRGSRDGSRIGRTTGDNEGSSRKSLRDRMENARKDRSKESVNSRDGKPEVIGKTRDREPGNASERKPVQESSGSDLRARIEAARNEAERNRGTRESRGRDSKSEPSKNPATIDRGVRNPGSATDARSRIDNARKPTDARNENSNRTNSNRTRTPGSDSTKTPSSNRNSSSDLRARIEAARKASASQRGTMNRATPSSSNDLRTRGTQRTPSRSSDSSPRTNSSPRSSIQDAINRSRQSSTPSSRSSTPSRSATPSRSTTPSRSATPNRSAAPSSRSATPSRSTPSRSTPSRSSSSTRSSSSSSRSASPSRSAIPSRSATPTRSSSSSSRSSRSAAPSRSATPSRSSSRSSARPSTSSRSSSRPSARSSSSSSRSSGNRSSGSSRSRNKK